MKTPREILLRQHQAASPKLDAIRAAVIADLARPPSPTAVSWREWVRSLRWHLAAMSAAWVVVVFLNADHSRGAMAEIPHEPLDGPRQICASLRESRRLLLQYTDAPAMEQPAAPGRRSEIETEQVMA